VKERERLLFQIGTKRKVPPHLNKTRAAYCLLMIAQTRCYLRLTELYTFSARLQIHNPSNSLGRSRELEKPRLKIYPSPYPSLWMTRGEGRQAGRQAEIDCLNKESLLINSQRKPQRVNNMARSHRNEQYSFVVREID
jgi:hypothetical protein